MKKEIVLISAIAALSTTGAFAGDPAKRFQKLDTNEDGQISAQEAEGHKGLNKQWGMLDRDNNDLLDQSEFSAFEYGQASEEPMGETIED